MAKLTLDNVPDESLKPEFRHIVQRVREDKHEAAAAAADAPQDPVLALATEVERLREAKRQNNAMVSERA